MLCGQCAEYFTDKLEGTTRGYKREISSPREEKEILTCVLYVSIIETF
jgi:hypothetical protein